MKLSEIKDIVECIELNDMSNNTELTAEAFTESFNDVESATTEAIAIITNEDSSRARAATLAMTASFDYDATVEALSKSTTGVDKQRFANQPKVELVTESFSSASPTDVAALNYSFNYDVAKQEPLVEAFFPTIVQPVGTRTVSMSVNVDYIINPFTRLDGKPGNTKDRAVPFVKTKSQLDIYSNRNQLIPVSDRDVALDGYFIKALEHPAPDPFDGGTINTAPLAIGETIAILDLAQSANEVAKGVMDNRTTLSPNPTVSALVFQVGAENFKIDTSNSGSLIFTESAIGDEKDMVLNAVTRLELPIRDLVTIAGAAQTIVTNLPSGFRVVYDLLLQGEGNIESGHVSVHANRFDVVSILDASGNVVPTTHASYATYLADAVLFTKATLTGYYLDAYLVNDDMHRIGYVLTLKEKTQPYHLVPSTPITIQAPVKGLAGVKSDARYIPTMARKALVDNNYVGIDTIIGFLNYMRNNYTNGVSETETVGISRYLVNPWFKTVSLNLKNIVDSLSSSVRREDIKSAIANQLKVMVDDMVTTSNYADAVEGVKDTIDIVIGVHSSLATWIGNTVDLGDGFRAKVYSTRKKAFIGRIVFAPANFSSTRNTEADIFSFGAHFYTPTLIGETIENKNRELSVQLINKHATFCPIIGEIVYTGLDEVVAKVAQWEKVVV